MRRLALALAFTLLAAACGDDDGVAAPATTAPAETTTTTATTTQPRGEVIYRWSGTASSLSITMVNASGGTEQRDSLANNQELNIGRMRRGDFVYVSLQNEGERGSVTCEIEVDGEVVARASSSGAFVIATCDGTVP